MTDKISVYRLHATKGNNSLFAVHKSYQGDMTQQHMEAMCPTGSTEEVNLMRFS